MPEIEEECTFNIAPGNVKMQTQVNGDQLTISGLHFTKEDAASLAWLLNDSDVKLLKIKIKKKE